MVEISVIVPAYNAEKYLENTVKSILKQTFSDFELILVNDGSLDKTPDIMNALAQEDKRITVINKKNEGVGFARNAGMRAAKGKYLYFADADDILHPQLLAFLYQACEKEQADFACCNFVAVKEGKLPEISYFDEPEQFFAFDNPLEYMCANRKKVSNNVWTKLYNRNALGELLFSDNQGVEDLYFNILALKNFSKGVFVPLPLYYYVLSSVSITRSDLKYERLQTHMDFYLEIKKKLSDDVRLWKKVKQSIINRSFYDFVKEVSKIKDPKKRNELKSRWVPLVNRFIKDGIIGTEGFSFHKRLKLFFFLHF